MLVWTSVVWYCLPVAVPFLVVLFAITRDLPDGRAQGQALHQAGDRGRAQHGAADLDVAHHHSADLGRRHHGQPFGDRGAPPAPLGGRSRIRHSYSTLRRPWRRAWPAAAAARRAGMRPARQRTPGQPGPPALATHPQPAQALVDVGQLERSHLPGPQASQQHRQRDRPVAVGRKVSKERGHLRGSSASGSRWGARTSRPHCDAGRDRAGPAPRGGGPQPLAPPRRGHRVLSPDAEHSTTWCSNSARTAATRRLIDDGAAPACRVSRTTLPAAGRRPVSLPGDPVEQVRGHDLAKAQLTLGTEPGKAQHVVGVGPHGRQRERPDPQVLQEQAGRRHVRPRTLQAPLDAAAPHPDVHHDPPRPAQSLPGAVPGVGPQAALPFRTSPGRLTHSGFVEQIFFQWLTGKSAKAVTPSAASRSMASIFGSWRAEHARDDVELLADVGGIRLGEAGPDGGGDHLRGARGP
jgi:hypothetical protein